VVFSSLSPTTRGESGIEKQPLPSGTLVRNIGNWEAWEIDFKFSQSEAPPEDPNAKVSIDVQEEVYSRPQKATLIRTAPFWYANISGRKSANLEFWSSGTDIISKPKESPAVTFITAPPPDVDNRVTAEFLYGLTRGQFPSVDWVGPSTYLGIQNVGKSPCMVFQKDGASVWVDVASRVPVIWRKGEEIRIFKRLDAPSEMIKLPNFLEEATKEAKRAKAILANPAPRGG
jgi:hypothetical protein